MNKQEINDSKSENATVFSKFLDTDVKKKKKKYLYLDKYENDKKELSKELKQIKVILRITTISLVIFFIYQILNKFNIM
jgi:hypothetical protein